MASPSVSSELTSTVESWTRMETMVTVFIALTAITWYAWRGMRSSKRQLPLPPGPRGLPLVGYLPFINSDLHLCFEKLSRTYGPIITLQLGWKTCIVVSSADLAREIAKEQDPVFANRDVPLAAVAMNYGAQDIGWAPNGPHFRLLSRVLAREVMSKKGLESFYSLRRQEVRQMVGDVYAQINSPIDISELIFLTVLNVLTGTIWGATLDRDGRRSVGAEFRQYVQQAMALSAKPNISDFYPVLAPFDLQGVVREMKKLAAWADQILESVMSKRRKLDNAKVEEEKLTEENKDFLQSLLQLTDDKDRKTPFTRTDIKALLLDMLVAGTDTTSTMTAWTLGRLLKHPECRKKVLEELDQVVGRNNIVEENHVTQLTYLDAVIKETHRLHPALPFLMTRSPSETTVVGGYTIPKGCRVIINAWAIQRDPSSWKDPLEFKPERFFTDEFSTCEFRGTDHRYVPFGSGRRTCSGLPLAERMLPYLVATLLHSFEWRWPEGKPYQFREKFGIVTKPAEALIAIPKPRLSKPELYA